MELSSRARRSDRGGWTLLELSFGITLLVVGLLASSRVILQTTRVSESAREVALATAEARRVVETLQATDLDEVFATFNANPADDPGGAGTAPGAGWDVTGLSAMETDADGLAGEIVFPSAGAMLTVREDIPNPALGMPRDLNGDGLIDSLDHSADFRILPVIVRVRWQGASGQSKVEFRTVLADF